MEDTNALIQIESIEQHLTSKQMIQKFKGLLDQDAMYFIRSVMIAVEANPKLQQCTPESIGIAALEAATLRLSCLPQMKQGQIIPYLRNKKLPGGKFMSYYDAKFSTHYLGDYTLAKRTGLYEIIDVIATPAGYKLVNVLGKGEQLVDENDQPVTVIPKIDPRQAGGWYAYYVTYDGFTKKVHMTKAEIHRHGQTYSKAYAAPGSLWKDPNQCFYMEMKTVLRALLKWAEKSTQTYGTRKTPDTLEVVDAEPVEVLPSGASIPVDEMFPV